MVTDGLKERVMQRVNALDLNPNAASEAAGLSRDYIRSIMEGKSRNPKTEHALKLARVLKCRLEWLLTGEGPVTNEVAELSPAQRAALDQFDRLPPDEQARAIKIMRGLEPDDGKPSEAAS